VGYETYTVSVNNKTSIVASLKVKPSPLDEVIIKPYWTETKRMEVGNSGRVTSKDIENQPYENPILALEGRVPGIQITQLTGLPGGGATIRIQGRNSINSGLEPLIVVDGVPYPSTLLRSNLESIVQEGSPLNYINTNDIESIDVLKDADATAIYGSRAANGAILITTKKGKAGKTKVSFNVQQGWGKVGHFVDMMNTRQYLDMRYEAYQNDGIDLASQTLGFSNYDLKLWDTTRYTDWQKELIGGTAKYTNINTSFSGGNTLFQYLIGANYNKQTTVFPGSFDDKKGGAYFNFSGNSSNQKFKAQFSGNYMYDEDKLPQVDLTQQALWMVPNAPALYDQNGNLNWAKNAAGSSTWTNPLAYVRYKSYNNTTKNLFSNLTLSYQLFKGLDIRSSLGYNNIESSLYLPTTLGYYRPQDLPFSQREVRYGQRNMTSWIVEPQIHYSSRIWKGKLDALLGGTVQQTKADVFAITGTGYSTDLLMKTLTAATSVTALSSGNSQTKFNALFGRINYVIYDKYILDLTARRDGSSKFGDNNKLHNFGSVGGAWIISGERWVQRNLRFLSFAKLRSSYGITGNDQIGDFTHLSSYNISNPSILYQGAIGLQPARVPNPNLQWEETRKWQSGIDLGFFSDRIVVGATYARNRSSNQIVSYPLPSTTGFTFISENLPALIQNTSLEFTLQTTNIKNRDFSWSTSFNLTIPRNKLLRFPGIEKTGYIYGTNGVIVGQSLGVIKTFRYAGVDPSTGDYTVYDSVRNITSAPDFNTDKTVLISNLMKFYGGIQNAIHYNSFQLDINVQFVRQKGSNDMYYYNGFDPSYFPGYFVGAAFGNQPAGIIDNHWKKLGDNAEFSRFSTDQYDLWPGLSDAKYSFNASYIRIKNVSLSWTVPSKMLKNVKLQNLVLYFRGDNVFTFTKYKGLDPESMSANSLPPLRVLTLGLKIDL
jgi:TonB-linked SusC/RagA family outer membrane protein